MTLKVHGSDRKDYEFPYTETTTVANIIEEIRKVVSPDVAQIDLLHGSNKLAEDTTITSLKLGPTAQLKFFVRRHSKPALTRSQTEGPPRARYGLPRRTDTDQSEIREPPDFESRIATLTELALPGITREHCMKALRTAYFDINRASQYLLAQSGGRPPPRAVDPVVKEITPEVREALARLEAQFPGIERPTVIQIFLMADKDEGVAVEILRTVHDQ